MTAPFWSRAVVLMVPLSPMNMVNGELVMSKLVRIGESPGTTVIVALPAVTAVKPDRTG